MFIKQHHFFFRFCEGWKYNTKADATSALTKRTLCDTTEETHVITALANTVISTGDEEME